MLVACLLISSARLPSSPACGSLFPSLSCGSLFPPLRGGGTLVRTAVTMCDPLKGATADKWLQSSGVDFEIIEQKKATGKCRDSAAERCISLRQIVKSLVFADQGSGGEVRYLQAMVPGGHPTVSDGMLSQQL